MKHGVQATASPSITVWWIDTWCPPNRHDQVPLLGSPKIRT